MPSNRLCDGANDMGFLTLIRLIRQYGLKKLLFLRGYMNGIIDSVYEAGSLRNVDLDEDGKIDGFTFKMKNPVYNGYYKVFELEVDSEKIPAQDIEISSDNKILRANQVSFQTPLCLISGQPSEITVYKSGGLKAGKHKIRSTMQLRNATSQYLQGEMEFTLRS